jgi:peptidoglycan/LPS O-acetylase OafA/YrhL
VATPSGRVDYLDGLRAIAIGAVLSVHWLAWYSPLFHGGYIGVDVFFVLSGFIITTMLWRSALPVSLLGGWWSFLRRRAIRLYPALIGLVVVSVLLYAATPESALDAGQVAWRGLLVLVQASAVWGATQSGELWLPALHPFAQTWSLAIEWYFYLLWPLAVLGARMRDVRPRTLAAASLGAAALLYAASLPLGDFWFYFGPSARFAELLVGCALALAFQAYGTPTGPWRHATGASTLALIALAAYTLFAPSALSPVSRYLGAPMTVLATTVLVYTGYSNPGGPVHRLLSHRWLATIGRYSYSLYLWHVVPMLVLAGNWLELPIPVLGLIAVAASVALTIASYRLLERPFLRARSDVLRPSPPEHESSPAR